MILNKGAEPRGGSLESQPGPGNILLTPIVDDQPLIVESVGVRKSQMNRHGVEVPGIEKYFHYSAAALTADGAVVAEVFEG